MRIRTDSATGARPPRRRRVRRAIAAFCAVALGATVIGAAAAAAAEPQEDWTSTVGASGMTRFYDAAAAQDGAVVVAGWLQTDDGGGLPETDGLVRKISATGQTMWETTIGDEGTADWIDAVDVADDGTVFVTGRTRGDIGGRDFGTDFDFFVSKLSSTGVVQWSKQFANNGVNRDDAGEAIAAAPDGSVFVGVTTSVSTKPAVYRYDANGTELWAFVYGSDGDRITDMVMGGDGSAYLAGVGAQGEGFLMSASLGGTQSSNSRMPGAGALSVGAAPNGDVVAGGNGYLGRFGSFGLSTWTNDGAGLDITDVDVESDGSILALVDGSAVLRGFAADGDLEGWSKSLSGESTGTVVATSDGGAFTSTPASGFTTMNLARFTDSVAGGGGSDFTDVPPDSFYADAVEWLKSEGITTGTSPTTYSPDENVTRAQMAAFLHRLVRTPAGNPGHGFSDVPAGTFYAEAVKWLKHEGITTGTSPTTYSPNDVVTRGQMAAFLFRLAGSPAGSPDHGFSDVSTGAFYAEAVAWLKDQGITTGTSATTYSPDDPVTRGQMAAFLFRLATGSDWVRPS